jgi:hypothetical protein
MVGVGGGKFFSSVDTMQVIKRNPDQAAEF